MLTSFILLVFSFINPSEPVSQPDFCELKGAVYVEKNDANMAQFSVYIQESEAFAQVLVFEEDSRTYADKPGLWYFVENPGMADFIIYYVEEEGMADFSIYFTDIASFAGCQ
jgi:hypothetical protein